MIKFDSFRRALAMILMIVLAVLVVASIPSFCWSIIEELMAPPIWLVTVEKIRAILDLIIHVIITFELIESISVYLEGHAIPLEKVVAIAIIAMARKVIAVYMRSYDPVTVIGMAAIIMALGATYYLIRKAEK